MTADKAVVRQAKMELLLGLRGFSVVKMTDLQARWKINSNDSITIDVSFPPELWEVIHKGQKIDKWVTDNSLPANIRGMIQALVEDLTNICAEIGIDITSEKIISPELFEPYKTKMLDITGEPAINESGSREGEANRESTEPKPVNKVYEKTNSPETWDSQIIHILEKLLTGITDHSITRKPRADVSEEVKVS